MEKKTYRIHDANDPSLYEEVTINHFGPEFEESQREDAVNEAAKRFFHDNLCEGDTADFTLVVDGIFYVSCIDFEPVIYGVVETEPNPDELAAWNAYKTESEVL